MSIDLLQAMKVYVCVVESGGFSRAAPLLQLQRPAVSKVVQGLENQLGTRLLNRTTRKMSLTAEGKVFYEHSISILNDVENTFNLLRPDQHKPKGKLRLELPVALIDTIISELNDFKYKYPEIELIIGVTDQITHIIEAGVDCAVRIGELESSDLIARPLGYLPFLTCAAPKYIEQYGEPKDLVDLAKNHLAIQYFTRLEVRPADFNFIVNDKETSIKIKNSILTNETGAYIACGLAGLGIIQTLATTLEVYLLNNQLVPVLTDIKNIKRKVSVVYANREYLAPKIRVFIDWLVNLFHHKFKQYEVAQ